MEFGAFAFELVTRQIKKITFLFKSSENTQVREKFTLSSPLATHTYSVQQDFTLFQLGHTVNPLPTPNRTRLLTKQRSMLWKVEFLGLIPTVTNPPRDNIDNCSLTKGQN